MLGANVGALAILIGPMETRELLLELLEKWETVVETAEMANAMAHMAEQQQIGALQDEPT